jgi:hypothetical protein
MKRILFTAAAAAAVLAGSAAAAAPAMASNGPTAVTHLNNHPDTTSVSGSATVASPGGPVWAYDNITEKFTVTPEAAQGMYSVTIDIGGSFHGFADPRMASEGSASPGGPLASDGSVKGTITYDVSSPANGPDPAALPGQSPSDAHLGGLISQLFDGNGTIVGGGAYSFTYHKVGGADYTQVG